MARVLVPGGPTWFEELKAVVYYSEGDLEREIKQHASELFPGYHVFPFKQSIYHQEIGNKKPDLAMVRKDVKGWGIIEVEVHGDYKLDHVLDQTKCFIEGEYNAPIVSAYIHSQIAQHCNVDLNKDAIMKLVQDERPVVVVIADQQADDWREELKKIGVDLCVFEIFKNVAGQFLYRTFGPYPVIPVQEAHCRRHKSLPNTMEIIGDFEFPNVGDDGSVEILYGAYVTKWTLFEDENVWYLQFLGKSNPVSPMNTYGLLSDETGRCFMRIN
jgi:hypothetical protein